MAELQRFKLLGVTFVLRIKVFGLGVDVSGIGLASFLEYLNLYLGLVLVMYDLNYKTAKQYSLTFVFLDRLCMYVVLEKKY